MTFDRHKIFLYKEDFVKFSDGLSEVIEFITRNRPELFAGNGDTASATCDIDKEFENL